MPSRDMLPFIQCHHTRGLASWGGLLFVLVFRLITLFCVGGVAALVQMTIALVEMTFALVEIVVAPAALALYLYKVMVTGPKSPAGISMFLVFLLQGYEVHV